MSEIINQEISIGVPDGFHIMSAEELTKVYVTSDPKRWGIWDQAKKGYEGHGYALEGFRDAQISGHHARGYSFTYDIQDVHQHVATLLFKAGKRIYSINCIGRNENCEADQKLFEDVLKTVSF